MASGQTIDEKVLDTSVEDLVSRARELKSALEQFLMKIEREHSNLTWPTVLDSFALLSGQMSSLFNLLQSEKIAPLQNYPVIPLRLSQDDDPFLQNLTEMRLMSLNHAVVPDYLRTKAIPEVEQTEKQMSQDGNATSDTAVKTFNKLCDRTLDKLKQLQMTRSDPQLKGIKPTFNQNDTIQLIAAVNYGKEIASMNQSQLQSGGAKMASNPNVKIQYSRP